MSTTDLPADLLAATATPEGLRRWLSQLPLPKEDAVPARAARLATLPHDRAERRALIDTAIRLTDLTTLEATDTPHRVRALASTARRPDPDDRSCPSVAAVCVYPDLIGVVATALDGTNVLAASVAGAFPTSRSPLPVKVAEVAAAVAAGADEIDVVLDRGAFNDGREHEALAQLTAMVAASGDAHVKVILETGSLPDAAAVMRAAWVALLGGADMVKTSTGKDGPGASLPATLVLLEVAREFEQRTGRPVGVKASGGIREVDDALRYLTLVSAVAGDDWLTPSRFRFGASSLLANLVSARR